MSGSSPNVTADRLLVSLPASRAGLTRKAAVRLLIAAILGLVAARAWIWLDFSPSAIGNRIVQLSLAVALVPLFVAFLLTAWSGLRYLAAGAWPGPSGVEIREDRIVLRRGLLPAWTFPAAGLDLRYYFDMDEDEHGGVFESYLPEAQQRRTLLPPLRTGAHPEPVRLLILRWTAHDEAFVAERLAAGLEALRRRHRPDLCDDGADASPIATHHSEMAPDARGGEGQ